MPVSVSSPQGDDVRSSTTDFGSLPFNPDTLTNAQLTTYANNTITNIAGAVQAWLALARFCLLAYRKYKQLNARVSALEKK